MSWRDRLVERDTGYITPCHVWPGALTSRGYGHVSIGGRDYLVHRLSWIEAHG